MAFTLAFHPQALAERRKLDAQVAQQFKKKLAVPSACISGGPDL